MSEDLTMNFERGPDTHARVLVQRQAAPLSAIELGFVSVVRLNVVPPPDGHDQIIFDATLRRIDDAWLWLPESDWDRISVADDACTWVSARRLFWRDASDWLGKTLRYGSSDPSFSVR
ncbi:MAG: hypothetical protein L6Q99_18225 [Planctomycetes bacterium]|nr:hypothetical protein [Planctomycetota bacterium]